MILFLSDLWPPFPGGAERLAFNLARYLMQTGEDVTVLTGYEEAKQFDGPPVTILPLGIFDDRPAGAELLRDHLANTQPDVILTHHLYAHQFGPELDDYGAPYVQIVLNGRRLPRAALAVSITNWVAQRAEPKPGDLIVYPPAFDDVVAVEHGDAVGFIKPIRHKGVDVLYQLADRLPDRRFVVLRGEWQDIEDIRPAPNVTFMEPVDDIRDFYREVRLLLMPSVSEDAGTVAQEATLNGLPCVSSDVDGLAETNGGGVRHRPDDVDAFARSIEQLDDPRLYAEVVDRQRRHLERSSAGQLPAFAAAVSALAHPAPPTLTGVTTEWPLVWAEPTGTSVLHLRRYQLRSGDDRCPVNDYHSAVAFAGEQETRFHVDDDGRLSLEHIDPAPYLDDDRWPPLCSACGQPFADTAERQVQQRPVYIYPDGRTFLEREMPVGTMYHVWWAHTPAGDDGINLGVVIPRASGYPWLVDGTSTNCPRPGEPHRCWCRHGDPRTEPVTIDKSCDTCPAGAGSIQTPTFHGVVTAGVLRQI